jgi:hypothetical protein
MMTLPEDVFFDLLRSVFGHVKTPFNKQNLLSDLAAFLSREEVRRNIAAYLDEADAQVIAAVALLGNPAAAELEQFFADDGMGISSLLLNLEERFILYRYRENGALRLGLNPVLEPVLAAAAADLPRLFPSLPAGTAEPRTTGTFLPDDRFFAALIAFVLEEGILFRAENHLRKKVQDTGRRLFPGMDLEQAIRGLLCLGLCRFASAEGSGPPEEGSPGPEGEVLSLEERALESFAGLDARWRLIYWAAGLCLGANPAPDPQPPRERLGELTRLVEKFLGLLSPGRLYPPRTLYRLLFYLEREAGRAASGFFCGDRGAASSVALCAALEVAGLLRGMAQGYSLAAGEASPGLAGPPEPVAPVLTLDAPLFCLVYPGIAFADVLALALFTAVRETGRIYRFEITRESCLRGFERGLSAADMGELLARLSGNPVEDSLLWTLRDWEKRSAEISLYEGAVLALAPERCYLTEAEPLASLIRRELAPGLYLLDSAYQAEEALRKAGVDIIARRRGQPEADWAGERRGTFPPQRGVSADYRDAKGSAMMEAMAGGAAERLPLPGDRGAESLKARFHWILNSRALSVAERKELAARVERRLVLTETQLSSSSVRGEKLEARGLDYVGKASIAKSAIGSRSLVEVFWPAGDGRDEQRTQGIPLALEKSGGESVLVIEGGGNTCRVPLGKISLLRRIKKSMFET